jgi:hypothetical protein
MSSSVGTDQLPCADGHPREQSDDTIVVNGVVASVFSTGAKSVETLPFHMLHKFAKGALQVCPPTEPSLPTDHPDVCSVFMQHDSCIIWLN